MNFKVIDGYKFPESTIKALYEVWKGKYYVAGRGLLRKVYRDYQVIDLANDKYDEHMQSLVKLHYFTLETIESAVEYLNEFCYLDIKELTH